MLKSSRLYILFFIIADCYSQSTGCLPKTSIDSIRMNQDVSRELKQFCQNRKLWIKGMGEIEASYLRHSFIQNWSYDEDHMGTYHESYVVVGIVKNKVCMTTVLRVKQYLDYLKVIDPPIGWDHDIRIYKADGIKKFDKYKKVNVDCDCIKKETDWFMYGAFPGSKAKNIKTAFPNSDSLKEKQSNGCLPKTYIDSALVNRYVARELAKFCFNNKLSIKGETEANYLRHSFIQKWSYYIPKDDKFNEAYRKSYVIVGIKTSNGCMTTVLQVRQRLQAVRFQNGYEFSIKIYNADETKTFDKYKKINVSCDCIMKGTDWLMVDYNIFKAFPNSDGLKEEYPLVYYSYIGDSLNVAKSYKELPQRINRRYSKRTNDFLGWGLGGDYEGATPVEAAVLGEHWNIMRFLLSHGAKDEDALTVAITRKKPKILDSLLKYSSDKYRYTAASIAIGTNDVETLKMLITKFELDPNKYGPAGESPMLIHAVSNSRYHYKPQSDRKPDVLTYLLSLPNIDINVTDSYGTSAIALSYSSGGSNYKRPFYLLLDMGANLNIVNKGGYTLLDHTKTKEQPNGMPLLIEKGAKPGNN
jgi:hypothetical protein